LTIIRPIINTINKPIIHQKIKQMSSTKENIEINKEPLFPKQGHQVMLAAQSLFFRKLILEYKEKQKERVTKEMMNISTQENS
jgi:hypothetical protein